MTTSVPDFDQIAAQLAVNHSHQGSIRTTDDLAVSAAQTRALTVALAEQLRLVWNARGVADLATLDATVTYTKVASFEGSRRQTWGAIRELDR